MTLPKPTFRSLALALVALCLSLTALGERPEQLRPSNYVNDFASVLDADTQSRLNGMCLEVEQKTGAQISVVTIQTLEDQPVEDFAVALFKQWGIGKKGKDNGVLVLLAVQDHKYRVEVGYGLESILPDGKVGGFGREMVPLLRANNYNAALTLMTTRIAQTIAQDANVEITGMPDLPQRGNGDYQSVQFSTTQKIIFGIIGIIVLLVLITHPSLFFWILFNMFFGGGGGRSSGGFGGGGGGGFGGFGGGSSGGGGASGSW